MGLSSSNRSKALDRKGRKENRHRKGRNEPRLSDLGQRGHLSCASGKILLFRLSGKEPYRVSRMSAGQLLFEMSASDFTRKKLGRPMNGLGLSFLCASDLTDH
jgi:hypothetical protein